MSPHQDENSRESAETEPLSNQQRAFLAAYTKTGSVLLAAKLCTIPADAHRNWLAEEERIAESSGVAPEDLPYHAAFECAREESLQRLEAEARRRAERGVKKYRFYGGKPIEHPETGEAYYDVEYDTVLMVLLLKAMYPEKYHDFALRRSQPGETHSSGGISIYVPENHRGDASPDDTLPDDTLPNDTSADDALPDNEPPGVA